MITNLEPRDWGRSLFTGGATIQRVAVDARAI